MEIVLIARALCQRANCVDVTGSFACVQASADQERLKAAKNSIVGKLHSWACGAQGQHGEAVP